ncbi:hypothetical protein EIP91_006356 [Steccherinum ochraceum]|uniref:Uncharacterized protein n=1 Tax=Steccherinum ochraceum TaxID=92696 RepID=A0A4R0R8L4_9APHY|nr:hypothetical protein EIP91_006356 [Steccherinum ochraceum]
MTAPSSSSLSPPRRTTRPSPQKDVFKPRFPIDPFASAKVREPWFIKSDLLPAQTRRDVVLVLGVPTTQELGPLLLSKHLAHSLLILASHDPPEIPHTTQPAVRILRLTERLDIQDAGAVRFVNVLEWAERVGRVWRKHGGVGAVELGEDEDGQA